MVLNFHELRVASGLSQAELARRLNVSRNAVHQWEAGKRRPRTQSLPAVAAALGCSIDDLFAAPEGAAARMKTEDQ